MTTNKKIYKEIEQDFKEGVTRLSRRQFTMGTIALFAGISEALAQVPNPLRMDEKEGVVRGSMPPVTVSEAQANRMFPVHNEPKIMTMAKPLIIQCSSPGWQVGGKRYPAVPFSIEDQAQDLADAVRAGAIGLHVHPRNPKNGLAMINSALLKQVLDATFDKVGDVVTMSHTWYPRPDTGVDYIVDTNELLEWGEGNRYCQGSLVLPFNNSVRKNVEKGVKWLDEHDVKPLFQLYDTSAQMLFRELIDSVGGLKEPMSMDINLGKHDSLAIHHDPGSYLNAIANLDNVKQMFPNQFYGWRTGGRNWLPIMTLGIMMGVELVQVGIEDAYWRWPHRDELIESSAESVKWAVDIANVLGRRVVTDANEARKLLGMKLTSKV